MSEIKSHVFYCTICQYPEEALPNAYRVRPYVDEIIVVYNKTPLIDQVKAEFDDLDATLHHVDWKEDFSYKRTQYIRKTGNIIQEKGLEKGYTKNNTWMLISDTDEFPSISLLSNIQIVITKAEIEKAAICTINAHDYLIKGEGSSEPFTFIPRTLEELNKDEIISSNISNYFKELLVKYQDKLEYTGKVHHTLRGTGLRMIQAHRNCYYDHVKKDADLHSHGCRNWFIGGGGVQEFSDKWKELHSITDKYGLILWEDMETEMKIGNLHSDILQFFVDHKDDNDTSSDSELRSFYAYYNMLHPKELVGIIQNVKTVVTKDGIKSPIPKSEIGKSNVLHYDPKWKKEFFNPESNIASELVKSKNIKFNPRSAEPFPTNKRYKTDLNNESENDIRENDIRKFVEDMYNEILGRSGDSGGIENYTKTIMEGRLRKENLAKIFRSSEEYKEKRLDT